LELAVPKAQQRGSSNHRPGARRVLLSGGEVWSVRQGDIPDGKPLAAILRYAL
jgi:hypothetical protein